MQTFSLEALAEQFEVDRNMMMQALHGVPPDLTRRHDQPEWKVATAAAALEAYHLKMNRGSSITGWNDPELEALYDEYDAGEVAMRKLSALEARRRAARRLAPLLAEIDRAVRAHEVAFGAEAGEAALKADKMYQFALRGLEGPCEWTRDECVREMSSAASRPDE